DTPHGPGDVGRLVELEADDDVVGQGLLHPAQVLLDLVDHGQSRGVGALGDEHVHGAPPVDQGVACWNVGRVLDLADIAQTDAGARPNGDVAQFLRIGCHGVDADNRLRVGDVDVS